jgi:purine-binding chemotaxis protein CheW
MTNDEGQSLRPLSDKSSQEDVALQIKDLRKRLYELERLFGPAVREKVPQGQLVVLITRVGGERIAFLHDAIEEIIPMARLTNVPESPVWIAGILNLRGKMIPVIDVLARVQKKERRQELSDVIIVCQVKDRTVGLVVQEVLEIKEVTSDEVQSAPTDVPSAPHLMGMLQTNGWPVLLLSLNTLIATSDVPGEG